MSYRVTTTEDRHTIGDLITRSELVYTKDHEALSIALVNAGVQTMRYEALGCELLRTMVGVRSCAFHLAPHEVVDDLLSVDIAIRDLSVLKLRELPTMNIQELAEYRKLTRGA